MKRATLTAYPTAQPAEPVDLTDRLLQAEPSPAPARRRRRPLPTPAQPEAQAGPIAAAAPPASELATALAAADTATAALQQAARQAPARYDVALRYRLDALAHHLQQVKDFVANLAAR